MSNLSLSLSELAEMCMCVCVCVCVCVCLCVKEFFSGTLELIKKLTMSALISPSVHQATLNDYLPFWIKRTIWENYQFEWYRHRSLYLEPLYTVARPGITHLC